MLMKSNVISKNLVIRIFCRFQLLINALYSKCWETSMLKLVGNVTHTLKFCML